MAPETLQAVRERVAAGEYASLDAALDDAVRALQRQRREQAEHLDSIRARIRRSLDDPRPDLTSEEVRTTSTDCSPKRSAPPCVGCA